MITNGLRYTQKAGYGVSLLPSSDSIQTIHTSLISSIVDGTKPFFSKPLTTEAVQQKLVIEVRPEQATIETLTKYTLQWKTLFISSSSFRCVFEIVSKEDVLSHTLIDISFFEGEKVKTAETAEVDAAHEGLSDACETIPLSSADPISLGDARQVELEKLRRARMKAARALLRSEQQYSDYVERYGELESDWEDSSDEEDSEEEDEDENEEGQQNP